MLKQRPIHDFFYKIPKSGVFEKIIILFQLLYIDCSALKRALSKKETLDMFPSMQNKVFCQSILAPWCSVYHDCTTSFIKAWTQILRGFKFYFRRVGDLRWRGSLTMVPAGNKAKHLSSAKYTIKTIQFVRLSKHSRRKWKHEANEKSKAQSLKRYSCNKKYLRNIAG